MSRVAFLVLVAGVVARAAIAQEGAASPGSESAEGSAEGGARELAAPRDGSPGPEAGESSAALSDPPALGPRDTAGVAARGHWSVGVLDPLRYAVADGVEVQTHPLLFFVAPNVLVRLAHGELAGVRLTGEYGLSLPTPAMRLSKSYLFPSWSHAEGQVGWFLVPTAGLVASLEAPRAAVLTAAVDLALGLQLSHNDATPRQAGAPLDLLLAPALDRFRAHAGVAYDAALAPRWRARAHADVYRVGPAAVAGYAEPSPWTFSAGLAVDFRLTRRTRLTGGLVWYNSDTFAVNEVYERVRSNDFLPTLDLIWER